MVYDFVKKYPKTIVEILPEAAKVKYYSSKQLSIWLSTFRKDWSEELPGAYLAKLLEDNPIIKKVRNTVLNFRRLMKEKEGDKLAAWCNEVINDENENIKGFARGILGRAAFRIFKPFTKVLYQIGVTDQLKAKSTGSKILSDKCMVVQVLNFSEREW